MKSGRFTKARISKLQEAAIKVSDVIDTLNLTSDERTDLYAALLYAHVKHAQHDIGELPGLECVLERFSRMVSKLLTNTKLSKAAKQGASARDYELLAKHGEGRQR